jgi:hypothetical protein
MDVSNKNAIIVIIDSGIDSSISDLENYVIDSTGFFINKDGYIIENQNMPIKNEHGTVISLIIRHICKDVSFISINILDKYLRTDGRVLLNAIDLAIKYKPDIIHMSLGTTNKRYKRSLKKLVKQSQDAGCLIIASTNNHGIISYPAYIDGVIRVSSNKNNDTKIFYKDNLWYAPPHAKGITGMDQIKNQNIGGNSLAAAYITGYISKACTKQTDYVTK